MKKLIILTFLIFPIVSFSSNRSKILASYKCMDRDGRKVVLEIRDDMSFVLKRNNVHQFYSKSENVSVYVNDEEQIKYRHEFSKFFNHPWFEYPTYIKTVTEVDFDKETRSGTYYNYYRNGIFSFGHRIEYVFTCD